METILRIQINAFCLAVLAVTAFSIQGGAPIRRGDEALDLRVFRLLVLSIAAMLVLDAAGWVLDGAPGGAARAALWTVDSLYFAVHVLPTVLYILYADFQVHRDPGRTRRLAKPLGAVAAVTALACLSTPFTRLLFTIDEANRYARGPGFAVLAVLLFGMTALSFVPAVEGRRKIGSRLFWTLLAYPVPTLAAAAAQSLHYGLVLIWPATTIFLAAAAMNIHRLRGATDHLTGAANRRSLDEELERLAASASPGRAFGGILVDLDGFKAINDRHGHETGDRALEDASAILHSAVRRDDLVARYGGDEFILLLPGADAGTLAEVVERLRRLVDSHNASGRRPYSLALSAGAALYDPALDGGPARFLARLDAAMYADKAARAGAAAAGA